MAVEVAPLALARMTLPDFHPEAPGRDTVHGFLVRDEDVCVLVDTGVGPGNELIDRLYQPEDVDLEAALGRAGARLEDVTAVVNTHLHFDHRGNNARFPGIPIYVQAAELDASRAEHYTIREQVDFPGARYVALEGRHALSPHLELVPTPGHTPGHQSLVVRSGGEVQVIVAQAAYTAAEFWHFAEVGPEDPSFRRYLDSNATWSTDPYVRSLAELHALRPARAWFSHDATVWHGEAIGPKRADTIAAT